MRTAGLILAGGQSRRMGGGDKALLHLDGRPLLRHVIERLHGQVDALAISANGDPSRFAPFGLSVLADTVNNAGPLAGVLAGLEWLHGQGCSQLVTLPADTPFFPADLVERLQPAPAFAAGPERSHHLVALWPASAEPALRTWLRQPGSRAVARFAVTIGARAAPFPSEAPFRNLNTPEELAEARRAISRACASKQGSP